MEADIKVTDHVVEYVTDSKSTVGAQVVYDVEASGRERLLVHTVDGYVNLPINLVDDYIKALQRMLVQIERSRAKRQALLTKLTQTAEQVKQEERLTEVTDEDINALSDSSN